MNSRATRKALAHGVCILLNLLVVGMVPVLGASRNLIPHNAGFEVGTGGWRWYGREFAVASPGSLPENRRWQVVRPEWVPGDAAQGKASVRLTSNAKQSRFESFPISLQAGQKYTLSAWVKGSGRARLSVVGGEWADNIPCQEGESGKDLRLGAEWQRFSLPLTPKKNVSGNVCISLYSGTILLDGVQLEKGDLTDYAPVSLVEVDGGVNHPFGLLELGQPAQATVRVCAHGGSPRSVNLEWKIEVYSLRTMKAGKQSVKVQPEEPVSLTIPIDGNLKGGFRMALTATDSATKETDFWPIVYAVIPPPVKGIDPRQSPFGATGMVWGGVGSYRVGRGYASFDEYLELMRRCGIHGTREEGMGGGIFGGIACGSQRPDPAKIDWYDEYTNGLLENGVIPLPYVTPAVKWANTGEPFSPQSRFSIPQEEGMRWQAELLAKHYKGRISLYESFWETESWASPENVAKVGRWIAEGLKKGDPDCKLVGICPTFDPTWGDPQKVNQSWLARTLPLTKGIFDGFTAHLYYNGCPDSPRPNYPSFRAAITGMNGLLAKNGMAPVTYADTESGYASASMYSPYIAGNLATLRTKSEWTVRKMIIGLSLGVQRMFYFTFNPGGTASMFGWNMTPDPLVAAWTQMAQRLEGAKFREYLDQGPVQVYLFEGRHGRPFAVYWHLDTQDGACLNVILHHDNILFEDMMGNTVGVKVEEEGVTMLPLSTSPGYVVLRKGHLATLKAGLAKAVPSNVKPRLKLASLFGDNIPAEIVATATAFNTVMERLKQAEVLGPVSPCPAVKGTLFKMRDGQPMAMIWLDTYGEGIEIGYPLPAEKIQVLDIYGNPLPRSKTVKAGFLVYPLAARPMTILGKGISADDLKRAVESSQVYGLTLVKVGRLSMAAVGEQRVPSLVVSVRNEGTQPVSGTLTLQGAPAQWGMNQITKFGPVEKGQEMLISVPVVNLPMFAYRVPISGEVALDDGSRFPAATRQISLLVCPQARGSITLDGSANDAEWAGAAWFDLEKPENVAMGKQYWQGPADNSMKVGMLWRERGLYFAFKVKDDFLKQDAIPSQLFQQDCIELWFDVTPDQRLFDGTLDVKVQGAIQFAPKGGGRDEDRKVAHAALYPLFDLYSSQVASRRTADGWEMEVRIPCTKEDLAGRIAALDIGLDDMDDTGGRVQIIWAGDANTFKDPSQWGFLIFR